MQSQLANYKFVRLAEETKLQQRDIRVAKSIIDSIEQIQTEQHTINRWVFELLQNAVDSCCPDRKLLVKFRLTKNYLEFSHNGKAFNLEDIINLIEQGSSKERLNSETYINENQGKLNQIKTNQTIANSSNTRQKIGKFGTGFLTTYILSKRVKVIGVFKHESDDSNQGESIPEFREFELTLNRDAEHIDWMVRQIQESSQIFKELSHLDTIQDYEEGENLDTKFIYELNDQTRENAVKGLEVLRNAMPYILLLNRAIHSITIENKIQQSCQIYEVYADELKSHQKTIKIGKKVFPLSILQFYIDKEEKSELLLIEGEKSSLSCEIKFEDGYYVIKKDSDIPLVFVDFPLFGFDALLASIVFNSRQLKPNEKRTGLILDQGTKGKQNKEIFQEMVKLYQILIDFALIQNFISFENLFIQSQKNILINNQIKDQLFIPCIQHCIDKQIIRTNKINKRSIVDDIYIPNIWTHTQFSKKKENEIEQFNILSEIIDSLNQFSSDQIILKEINYVKECIAVFNHPEWSKKINPKNRICIDQIIEFIHSQKSLNNLILKKNDPYDFLNKVYSYVIRFLDSQQFTEYFVKRSILPNRDGNFCSIFQLKLDDQIDQFYLDLCYQYQYDIKQSLVSNKIEVPFSERFLKYSFKELENVIISSIVKVLQNSGRLFKQYYGTFLKIKKAKKPKFLQLNISQNQDCLIFSSLDKLELFCFKILSLQKIGDLINEDDKKLNQFQKKLIELVKTTVLKDKIQPIQNVNLISHNLVKICQEFVLTLLSVKIKSCSNVKSLRTLIKQNSESPVQDQHVYNFLCSFYEIAKDRYKLLTKNAIITPKLIPNEIGNFMKGSFQVKQRSMPIISFNIIDQDPTIINLDGIEQLYKYYVTFTQNGKDQYESKVVNRRLNNSLIKSYNLLNLETHVRSQAIKTLSVKEICQSLDNHIINTCNNRLYIRQNEEFFNNFENLYSSTFSSQEEEHYFPQYTKRRLEIIVELRQTGDVTKAMHKIFCNKQEQLLFNLVEIDPCINTIALQVLQLMRKFENQPKVFQNLLKELLTDYQGAEIDVNDIITLIEKVQQLKTLKWQKMNGTN
ncbi:histidine kinase [Stylonychia lemnae]|uniref:Histidine kinase n=1 Tax=Stylonychia lemnae TaxID=5949 RepID=A0A078A3Q4_STYLE|nr:histidine kinase [Stylonychia lemnae]|eukprot:CDW76883.1 histidine kinase [Stylonychia lemnae]